MLGLGVELVTGTRLHRETRVGAAREHLRLVALYPPDASAHPEAKRAIEEADLIIFGPGSLFTSIVPNLLVREIAEAVADAGALKMYVCNVAGQPGETAGFSILDHVDVIRYYAGDLSVSIVIANNKLPQGQLSHIADLIAPEVAWRDPAVCVLDDIIDDQNPTHHDPAKLAATVTATYRKYRGKRRRLPLQWHSLRGPTQPGGSER